MLGVGRTVKGGSTVEYEFVQIRADANGRLGYVANPSGQTENTFPILRLSEREVVFEDLEHDFPQRVLYRLGSDGRMTGRIEGRQGGKERGVDFPLRRVDCETWLR
jgi:hypothetical protein